MGVDVTILEQDANSERSSHNAGIQVSDNVREVLRLHERTGVRIAVEGIGMHWSTRHRKDIYKMVGTRFWTNWGLLYRVLRANFDGYTSKACPEAPDARVGDGKAQYLTGKRVTGLQYKEGLATVLYVDHTGREQSITAELVIGADGARSTIKRLVQAPSVEKLHYTGFFTWRGAVPRKMVSQETDDYFKDKGTLQIMGGKAYMVW